MSTPSHRMTVLAPVPHTTTNFAPVWLADALGCAEAEGLDYRVELSNSPKESVERITAGQGDATFVNIVFALLSQERGVSLRPFYAFVRKQNRAFSVPVDSPIKSLADLRGATIGLHYDDPELFQFACVSLKGAGVDPEKDVSFKPLAGSPLDAPRMAAAVRDGEVQAIWQLDVLAGLLEAEGVPVRLLPAPMIDPLTPSSCFITLEKNLQERPEAYAALGRAIAAATRYALERPEETVKLIWERYPDARPGPQEDAERAFRGEVAALKVRLEGHRIEQAPIPLWGAISTDEIARWQDFFLQTGAFAARRDPRQYFSDALVPGFNAPAAAE